VAVEQLIRDTTGRPLEVVQAWYRSDIYWSTVEVDHQARAAVDRSYVS